MNQIKRLQHIYREYPKQFWTLIGATFIDRLGGALLFPFFTLYVTAKFGISMTTVGILFGMFSLSAMVGGLIGGGMTDRFGRKGTLIFGLLSSAAASVLMGLMDNMWPFFIIALVSGVFSEAGGPAHQAMVADLLPENKRAEGFGILRIAFNLAVAIGPAIGGFLAARSYLLLFIMDAIASTITALIVLFTMKETKPETARDEEVPSMSETFKGYLSVLKDNTYIAFLAASTLMVLVYVQMNSTMAVYLRDFHGIREMQFGYIMSLNAAMVVLMQFAITRKISSLPPMVMMALGCVFYAVGFAMYGFFATFGLFLFAIAVVTIGEMIVSPVGQAVVAMLSPEDMRGRYMAINGFSWMIGFAIGPLIGGLIIDNLDPRWLWWGTGILSLIAALSFMTLRQRIKSSTMA